MLDKLWYLALDIDKTKKSNERRDHILRVLNEVANGGKGVRAAVGDPDKEKNKNHPSLKWNQSCGTTADKILEVHEQLCSWLEPADKGKFKSYSKMWESYAAFNALQQRKEGVTPDMEVRCGLLARESLLRASQCIKDLIPYMHVQVSASVDCLPLVKAVGRAPWVILTRMAIS